MPNDLIDLWQPISSAPTDGTVVYVKRIYQGRLVKEGEAVFAVAHPHAPQRKPLGLDPLNRLSAADYARETKDIVAYADHPKWLTPDRMYSFPSPTHWQTLPSPPRFSLTQGETDDRRD